MSEQWTKIHSGDELRAYTKELEIDYHTEDWTGDTIPDEYPFLIKCYTVSGCYGCPDQTVIHIATEQDARGLLGMDSFAGVRVLLQAILDDAYPPNTIVCSDKADADIGAQLSAAARKVLELKAELADWQENDRLNRVTR